MTTDNPTRPMPSPEEIAAVVETLRFVDIGLHKQAADMLEALAARVAETTECLELLRDNQNGCPLPKYEKDWNHAVEWADRLLNRKP